MRTSYTDRNAPIIKCQSIPLVAVSCVEATTTAALSLMALSISSCGISPAIAAVERKQVAAMSTIVFMVYFFRYLVMSIPRIKLMFLYRRIRLYSTRPDDRAYDES